TKELKHALIGAYRTEIEKRYNRSNIERFAEFNVLSYERIAELRSFFLEHIYPPAAERERRDQAFDNLGVVITSPRKMLPLSGTALSSIWKLGRNFPAAVKAAFNTLRLYIESNRLEELLLRIARESNVPPGDIEKQAVLARIMRGLPQKEVDKFRQDLLQLFESLANVPLLRSSLQIMEHSREIMQNRADIYTADERAGLEVGYAMLTAGLHFFEQMSAQEAQLVLHGIDTIEIDWYNRMIAETPSIQN
ncbi:MAG: hypothetical protein KDK27_09945, partial [Leptospiraceae bacterium]|nr:hypothetical protein [Leptospiraceae bacterium]